MTTIIAVQSFRQGTGKTTVVANVAACLAAQGKTVGIADLNFPAPTLHLPFGVPMHPRTHHLNNYLWGECYIEEAIVGLPLPNGQLGRLFLLPASINPHDMMRMGRSSSHIPLLNTALQEFAEVCALDVLLLDSQGGLHDETLLTMALADVLWIILRLDQQDFQGTSISLALAERLAVENVALIVNEVPPQFDVEPVGQLVQKTYGRDPLRIIPHEPVLAALASSGVFCWQYPTHLAAQQYQELTATLSSPPSWNHG